MMRTQKMKVFSTFQANVYGYIMLILALGRLLNIFYENEAGYH